MTDIEQQTAEKIKMYRELAEKDKNVDLAALTLKALQESQRDEIAPGKKRLAYIISAGFPPFGLFFAWHYYRSAKAGGRHVAKVCLVLTGISIAASWLISAIILASFAPQIEQLQSANVNMNTVNEYKELMAP